MQKMIKYMKSYWWMLLLIVVLLATQAVCELALPSYTASIVDVGIQQQGVTSSVPTVVRQSTLHALTALMPEADAAEALAAYRELTADEAAQRGLTANEPVYALADEGAAERLEAQFTDTFALQGVIGASAQAETAAETQSTESALAAMLPLCQREGLGAAQAVHVVPPARPESRAARHHGRFAGVDADFGTAIHLPDGAGDGLFAMTASHSLDG